MTGLLRFLFRMVTVLRDLRKGHQNTNQTLHKCVGTQEVRRGAHTTNAVHGLQAVLAECERSERQVHSDLA